MIFNIINKIRLVFEYIILKCCLYLVIILECK